MTKLFRKLTLSFFLFALAGLAALLLADAMHGLRFTVLHQQLGASALILTGTSYISLQLSASHRSGGKLKGVFLGLAFVLWGSEQFLPASRLVTFMDSGVITIFVLDLGLVIFSQLKIRPA